MSSRRRILGVAALTAACFAAGHFLGGLWLQDLIAVLSDSGVEVASLSVGRAQHQVLLTSAAFASCAPLAALSLAVGARLSLGDFNAPRLLRATGIAFLGANLGIGGKAVAIARLAVPQAVERAAIGETLALDQSALDLAPWAFAGALCAAFLHFSVTGVIGMLKDPPTDPPDPEAATR